MEHRPVGIENVGENRLNQRTSTLKLGMEIKAALKD